MRYIDAVRNGRTIWANRTRHVQYCTFTGNWRSQVKLAQKVLRLRILHLAPALLLTTFSAAADSEDLLVVPGLHGRPGGRLVFAERTEPRTLNPVMAIDSASREVIQRTTADLIHINCATLQTEPALAKSWTVSADGLHYTLELRRGLRFSDGAPFDADDVVFTFQVLLDPKVGASQRDLLLLEGKPIAIRKLDAWRVAVDLPGPYSVPDRLLDGIAILPRHLLLKSWQEGRLADAWGARTPPAEMAGLGPFRLKEYIPGQRIILERNPYYWKEDSAGQRLPYLAEVDFLNAGTEDMQVMRLESGESDLIGRVGAKNFAVLERESARRGYQMLDAGPGLEFSYLFFNLNEVPAGAPAEGNVRLANFQRKNFRQAISAAIDRDAIVRLVYQGRATALASPVAAGNRLWIDARLPQPARSLAHARELLSADGYRWDSGGALLDPKGHPVAFSILVSSSNPERTEAATLIQADLKQLGMNVEIIPLETRSILDRVTRTFDYEAGLLAMATGDADPNPDMNTWLSSGGSHWWRPSQKSPATPWEAEIDALMRKQLVTRRYDERKRLFDQVQEILMDNLPLIPLVSPHILTGARRQLANFHPAIMDHYVLWNVEQMYWTGPTPGDRQ
jgi:peptide/nickel transport system substrate-binding protein